MKKDSASCPVCNAVCLMLYCQKCNYKVVDRVCTDLRNTLGQRIAALEDLLRPLTAFVGEGPPFDGLPDDHPATIQTTQGYLRKIREAVPQ